MFGDKLVLVYSAVAWVKKKHVIISNYSAWTRHGGGKIKGKVERKLSTLVLYSQQLIFVLLSKLRHHIVPSVCARVYHKYRRNIFILNFPTYPKKFYKNLLINFLNTWWDEFSSIQTLSMWCIWMLSHWSGSCVGVGIDLYSEDIRITYYYYYYYHHHHHHHNLLYAGYLYLYSWDKLCP